MTHNSKGPHIFRSRPYTSSLGMKNVVWSALGMKWLFMKFIWYEVACYQVAWYEVHLVWNDLVWSALGMKCHLVWSGLVWNALGMKCLGMKWLGYEVHLVWSAVVWSVLVWSNFWDEVHLVWSAIWYEVDWDEVHLVWSAVVWSVLVWSNFWDEVHRDEVTGMKWHFFPLVWSAIKMKSRGMKCLGPCGTEKKRSWSLFERATFLWRIYRA